VSALELPVEHSVSPDQGIQTFPCSSLTAKRGSLIGRDSNGLAVLWTGTAGERFIGRAVASVSAASTIDVDTREIVIRGTYPLENGINVTGAAAATDNGAAVYCGSDNLADSTLTEGSAVAIGEVERWISGALCWIRLKPFAASLGGGILTGDLELSTGGAIDINGITDGLIIDADADTVIDSPTDDTLTVKVGGTDVLVITTTLFNLDIAVDHDVALIAAGAAADIDLTFNHATANGVALDVSAAQITTARTSGTLTAVKAAITSLSGDTAGVDYYAFEAAVTVGAAGADHFAFKQGAGFDETIDSSACATTEAGWLVGANLADAWHLKSASLTYSVLKTTTATPGIDLTFALTGAEQALHLTTTANLASGAISGITSQIATITTNHTDGVIAAFKASITSLAGDTGGDFCGLHIVSVDGGGTTPFHSGIYCDDPLDAFLKVAADGDGGCVVGAMFKSPESDTEAGALKIQIGATGYDIPFYARS